MNFQLFQYINIWERTSARRGRVVVGDEDKHFCAFAIWVKYMFTRLQMRNPGARRQFSYSPKPMAACLELRPPPVADFWNSYLDEWLKFRHSEQESHYSYLRKNGIAVIFWCIACHPACKRDTLTWFLPASSSLPFSPMGPQRVALGDWSDAMASLDTCGKSAHPASQAKKHSACWSDAIRKIRGTREDYCAQLIYGHWSQAPESKIF